MSDEQLLDILANMINALRKQASSNLLEMGYRLIEAKLIAGHNWLPWLDHNFGWTEQTALNYIRLYELNKSKTVLDLDLPHKALYLLAAPSTPPEAVETVIERAKTGEKMTGAEIKKVVHEAKSKPSPRPPDSGTKKRGSEEIKRHDERMPDTSLKRSSAIIPIWPNGNLLSRQSKSSLEQNMSDSLFYPSAGIWPLKIRTSGPFDDLIASILTFGWMPY